MTVLLLSCLSVSLKGQIVLGKPLSPSTGEVLKTDTSKVIVPIKFIRDANAKLIEREYLLKLKDQQDSLLKLNRDFIYEQNKIIRDFQLKQVDIVNANNKLQKSLNKQKTNNKLLLGTTGVSLVITAIVLIIK